MRERETLFCFLGRYFIPFNFFRLNEVDDDLAALKQNIAVVNKKMQKNNIVITKLENCVQVTAARDFFL